MRTIGKVKVDLRVGCVAVRFRTVNPCPGLYSDLPEVMAYFSGYHDANNEWQVHQWAVEKCERLATLLNAADQVAHSGKPIDIRRLKRAYRDLEDVAMGISRSRSKQSLEVLNDPDK